MNTLDVISVLVKLTFKLVESNTKQIEKIYNNFRICECFEGHGHVTLKNVTVIGPSATQQLSPVISSAEERYKS